MEFGIDDCILKDRTSLKRKHQASKDEIGLEVEEFGLLRGSVW